MLNCFFYQGKKYSYYGSHNNQYSLKYAIQSFKRKYPKRKYFIKRQWNSGRLISHLYGETRC